MFLRRTDCVLILCTGILLVLLAGATADPATCADGNNNFKNEDQATNELKPPMHPRRKKLVLSINAANSNVHWERVNSLSDEWEVREVVLENFGPIMRDESFTAALESSHRVLETALEDARPDVLLAASKGVGVIAYLASKDLWIGRPVILLSPVPNPIEGLVDGRSWESEWSDTLEIMRSRGLGPVLVAAGSSPDEEMLISQALQEPSACGEMSRRTGKFEKCPGWRHVGVPGDHDWRRLRENEVLVSNLISYMFSWLERETKMY